MHETGIYGIDGRRYGTHLPGQSDGVLGVVLAGALVRASATAGVTGVCSGGGGGSGGSDDDDVLRGPGDSTPESAWSSTVSVRVFIPPTETHQTPSKINSVVNNNILTTGGATTQNIYKTCPFSSA